MPKKKRKKIIKRVVKIKKKPLRIKKRKVAAKPRKKVLFKKKNKKKNSFKKIKPKKKIKKRVLLNKKTKKRFSSKKNKLGNKIKKRIKFKKKIKKRFSFRKVKLKLKNKKNKIKKNKNKKILIKKKLKKLKTKKILIKKRPKKPKPETDFLTKSFFKAKIKVIGIGGGGGSIVSEIGRSLDKAKFVIADTETRNFKKRKGIQYFLFGQQLTHGLGTGLNLNLGKISAEQEKERIAKLFENQDMIIFVASLGGGVGSGATPVFAEISKNFKGISFGIFTLPFKFEGRHKYKVASKALTELRKSLNVSIAIANERIFKIIDSNTAITDAFSLVNKNLIESLESLIDLIYNPGVINIDFADLRTILKGKGSSAFLNTAQASGKNKLETITKELLYNPLYYQNPNKGNNFTGERVLFNITGGNDLNMFDINKISNIISDQNPKAKIIFGISKNSKYKDKIKVTILIASSPIVKDTIMPKVPVIKPLKVFDNKVIKKVKVNKKKKLVSHVFQGNEDKEKISLSDKVPQVFSNIPINVESSIKSSIIETPGSRDSVLQELMVSNQNQKKAIRRTALEIKKAQEVEENEKSQQEKEWEIPAFLRKINRIR